MATSANQLAMYPGDTLNVPQRFSQMKVREVEKLAGRKFTLKEKLVVKLAQKLEKRKRFSSIEDRIKDKNGNLSFIAAVTLLAIWGLLILLINTSAFQILGIVGFVSISALALVALWFGWKSKKNRGITFKNLFGIIVGAVVIILAIAIAISALTM